MTALSSSRIAPQILGAQYNVPVAADTKIYGGALVCLDANGRAVPGDEDDGLRALGVADALADNTGGAAGDIYVRVRSGIFGFVNSADADAVTVADVGETCYVVDDQTIAKTSAGGTRSPAGSVKMIDATGMVYVAIGLPSVGDGRKMVRGLSIPNLVGADAKVYRFVAPFDCIIKKVHSVINAALTSGDATLTAKIGATAVTGGVITITQSGSAAGDKDSATPTAANIVAAGDIVSITVGGSNASTSATAEVSFELELV